MRETKGQGRVPDGSLAGDGDAAVGAGAEVVGAAAGAFGVGAAAGAGVRACGVALPLCTLARPSSMRFMTSLWSLFRSVCGRGGEGEHWGQRG